MLTSVAQLDAAHCPAYILAGGQSRRFGSDKALVKVEGESLLTRLCRQLGEQGHRVQVVADRAERYQHLQINCLVDKVVGLGPMSGLATALADLGSTGSELVGAGWLLLISCDQLCWRAEWFERLSRQIGPAIAAACYADRYAVDSPSVALQPTGNSGVLLQPIPGLYHVRLLPAVLERLERQQLSLRDLLAAAPCAAVESQDNPRAWSFNTPEELARLRSKKVELGCESTR